MQKMQPLSYQIHRCSCWMTSVLNGFLVLYRDKNKIPILVYRLLNAILTDEGITDTGPSKSDWEIVLNAIEAATGCHITIYYAEDVGSRIDALHFNQQVAICDTEEGGHSVILTGRNADGWLEGFDPDWDNVKDGQGAPGKYAVFPEGIEGTQCNVNFLVNPEYFVASHVKADKLRMGTMKSRVLVVIQSPSITEE